MAAPGPSRPESSARSFLEGVETTAMAKVGRKREPEQPGDYPLAPIYIGMDDPLHRGEGYDIREGLLWRVGDPKLDPNKAAAKFMIETQIPAGEHLERFVVGQINEGLRPYQGWKDLGGEKLVRFKLYVRQGSLVFRDEVVWDVNHPHNLPDRYATSVCLELGLSSSWFDAITGVLHERIKEAREDLQAHPEDVPLEKPGMEALRAAELESEAAAAAVPSAAGQAGGGSSSRKQKRLLPCVEEYDGSDDWEAERLQHRAQLQEKWKREAGSATAGSAPTPPPAAVKAEPGQQIR